ncbi:MAG: 50S ribosomal protein L24 [Chloroflexi bacterium]|nr:50S ribosomal protein L24 [Chloroflexota bacterium]
MANKIRQGDTVEVISGNDRGVRDTVQRVLGKEGRVVVASVNVVKKHQRAVRAGRAQVQPGVISFEAPIDISNVMLVCPRCSERTRVGFILQDDGRKVRVCKKCNEVID